MPASQQAYYNFVAGAQAVTNAVETVVATARSVSSSYAGCIFAVEFVLDFLTGTGTTAVVWRIRQNSLTGTAILTTPGIAAAASTQLPRQYIAATDSIAGEVAGQQYVLTVVQTGGTSNGSATNAFSKITVAE